jgi:hypothetical protein
MRAFFLCALLLGAGFNPAFAAKKTKHKKKTAPYDYEHSKYKARVTDPHDYRLDSNGKPIDPQAAAKKKTPKAKAKKSGRSHRGKRKKR